MSESTEKLSKKERREAAAKKAKRKKRITLVVALAVVLVLAAAVIAYQVQQSKVETYGDGHQNIRLFPDGSFTAALYHDERYEGTYSKSDADGIVVIVFTADGAAVAGFIDNSVLTLPVEWQDDHGHGASLPKR